MRFRYKIKRDFWPFSYTVCIQYQADSCDKWKRFKHVDLYQMCTKLNDTWYFSSSSLSVQLAEVNHCIQSYGSMKAAVTAYILSILKDKKKNMNEHFDIENLKQMVKSLANNTWSDVIVIDEDEIRVE